MADEFRDAIAAARVWMPGVDAQDYHCGVDMADEILAMPEMQAIKNHFVSVAVMHECRDGDELTYAEILRRYGLPDSVIEWVLA